jgi:hypothetical protein
MSVNVACEFCSAELGAGGAQCVRCGELSKSVQVHRWSSVLVKLARVSRVATYVTASLAIATAFVSLSVAVGLAGCVVLQAWILRYFNQRIRGERGSLPGPAAVLTDTPLEDKKEFDYLATAMLVVVFLGSVALSAKALLAW